MRDLKADLERLDMQVERELALIKNMRFYAREQKEAKKLLTTYNALEIVTRRAWAEETRAIKAEALARELVEALEIFDTVNIDASLKERIEDAKKAQAVLVKAKEVLRDEQSEPAMS